MLEYLVVTEYELPLDADWENPVYADGYVLSPGEAIYDGDIEPDIVAKLLQRGVLVRADGAPWAADADAPDEDEEQKHSIREEEIS